MRIAVIPARGGSKRIPRKNIRLFCGKPMIAWSIEIARKAHLFDHVVVSTDDAEISEISKHWGAEVPFVRPNELSDDHAGTIEVIAHAANWAIGEGWPVSAICCIYPTAPFIRVGDLSRGLTALESGDWAYAFAVTNFPAPIFRAFHTHPDGGIEMFFPQHFETRSQDLPLALHDAGQFYWGRLNSWLTQKRVFDRHSFPIRIPRWRVQDIDTEEDWKYASHLFKLLDSEAGLNNENNR